MNFAECYCIVVSQMNKGFKKDLVNVLVCVTYKEEGSLGL